VPSVEPAAVSRIAHGELALYNPLEESDLDAAIALLDLEPGARVLDVACGTGETLRRIAARWSITGIGYDLDTELIERGRRAAAAGMELVVADEPPAGPFDLAVCIASSHALGGFPAALVRLCELVRPGGQILLGEGYWRRAPSPEYLKALGDASEDEFAGYAGLLEATEAAGLVPLWSCVASERDWDRYEWTLVLNCERWAAEHADDSAAETLRARAAAARRRLAMPGGRDTLGFALLLLRRD
jgi:SAM-dependent methyltransferase